jgi:hypothetical protein
MTAAELQQRLAQTHNRPLWLDTLRQILPQTLLFGTPQTIPTENPRAKSILQLGKIPLAGDRTIALLEVLVDEATELPGNRAALRHLVAKYIDQAEYHGVFAIFHQPNSSDYRFTFAARESALDDSGQVVRTETAPRRYTYLLGPNQSCRTAAERLDLLARKGSNATVADIRAAFDKEPLTREFFKRFEAAIEGVKSDLEKFQPLPSAQAYSRAQLLLERLLFLYFVQNRGWLDQKRNYLLDNFATHKAIPDEFTYYADFLEPVFFTLSTPPDFKGPGAGVRLPGLPFLNGGLFDDDEFAQTHDRKRDNPPLRVRNATFADVFENLLEAFNFTAHEDTPIDQDVAVDPEMLGKVFESIVLHAEAADPDAVAPDKRKATGSYYTPRIVVHFICRESLCQYLLPRLQPIAPEEGRGEGTNFQPNSLAPVGGEGRGEGTSSDWNRRLRALLDILAQDGLDADELTELKTLITPSEGRQILDLIRDLKCLDPSVGSGAFPVGLLHELVNLRRICEAAALGYVDPVRKVGNQWVHRQKAEIVENCLYGVDLQQQAIEICRLRLWLSLVVDYDLGCDPFSADAKTFRTAIRDISQLPNLEMNFRRGDSLLDMISGVPIRVTSDLLTGRSDEVAEIQKLGHQLHKARNAEKKKKVRLEILRRRLDLSQGVLEAERKSLKHQAANVTGNWFGETVSDSEQRKKIDTEFKNLDAAFDRLAADRKELDKLTAKPLTSDFYPRLRKLEGADFDSPFNFVWRIDYAEIFAPPKSKRSITGDFNLGDELAPPSRQAGFDLIVGNPPFVTARNPVKRELYRERWPRVCYKNYLLVCPFFDLSFGLLKPNGQLGFIVSNAFAQRDLGQPLVENLFPTVDLQKVVDCSGLLFPGHGTPTCIVFGAQRKPDSTTAIKVAAILPGGGDLRTQPEQSPLWHKLAAQHDSPAYADDSIVVAARTRKEMSTWPWHFVLQKPHPQTCPSSRELSELCAEPIGAQFITGKDEAFVFSGHYLRRVSMPTEFFRRYATGEDVRNWSVAASEFILFPYDVKLAPLKEPLPKPLNRQLEPHKDTLENCVISGSIKKKETSLRWFEFRRLARAKFEKPFNILNPHIATHCHFVISNHQICFKEKAIAIALRSEYNENNLHLCSAWLNSSLVLELLKRECFNKGAGEDEHRDRYEFAGEKLRSLQLPKWLDEALHGKEQGFGERLAVLSHKCWQRGQQLPAFALAKVFEKPDEAYAKWNTSLPGYVPPAKELVPPFATEKELRLRLQAATARREQLRAEMIALQEEMDWLVYRAYGLLPEDSLATGTGTEPDPLQESERPFRFWANANGDFDKAVALIPDSWPKQRRELWKARLAAIRDNEHIRRIEAPVYKRRWDEQWKVSNRWIAGPIAYAQELVDAFRYWLAEKAEWHLEHKAKGGPLSLDVWASALASDPRVEAAWPVVAEALHQVEVWKIESNDKKPKKLPTLDASTVAFTRFFRDTVNDETVPDGIPAAVPWEELDKKLTIPKQAKNIRGKLNVPRERFRLRNTGYLWAGTQ